MGLFLIRVIFFNIRSNLMTGFYRKKTQFFKEQYFYSKLTTMTILPNVSPLGNTETGLFEFLR